MNLQDAGKGSGTEMHLLTDEQLYALAQHQSLNPALKTVISEELHRRDFNPRKLEELARAYAFRTRRPMRTDLPAWLKSVLLLFPPVVLLHAILIARYVPPEDRKLRRRYWMLMACGTTLWLLILLLAARYRLFA